MNHANLIEGDIILSEGKLLTLLKNEYKFVMDNNPDFVRLAYTTFTIEHARELKEQASRKAMSDMRIFVVSFISMTREAGNALLKTLEEPALGTYFYLLTPSASRILPTIRSRCRMYSWKSATSFISSPADFVKASLPKRLEIIKEILAQLEKELITKSDSAIFVQEVIKVSHQTARESNNVALLKKLAPVGGVSSYSLDQSASLKMILEYIALSL